MNTDLETIENYLTGQLSSEERSQFEADLRTDPAVAEAVAFYLLAKQQAQVEARKQRQTELDALRKPNVPLRRLREAPMRWVAAASIIFLLGLGWYFFQPTDATRTVSQLTDEYLTTHFGQLPITMEGGSSGSGSIDSLKLGADLFNVNKLAEADAVFQAVLTRQPDNERALMYAGIVAFRQGNYDKAITQFHQLSQRSDLVANSGAFYEALARLKRGQPLDKSQARKLLEEVINRNLAGKREAIKLLEYL